MSTELLPAPPRATMTASPSIPKKTIEDICQAFGKDMEVTLIDGGVDENAAGVQRLVQRREFP